MKYVFAALFVFLAVPALAQNPVNPTALSFEHVDYAGTTAYEVGYFTDATAVNPVQLAPLPKPASCAPCSASLPSRPTAFQTWYVSVRAIAGSLVSPWSNRVPFDRSPLAPINLQVK